MRSFLRDRLSLPLLVEPEQTSQQQQTEALSWRTVP